MQDQLPEFLLGYGMATLFFLMTLSSGESDGQMPMDIYINRIIMVLERTLTLVGTLLSTFAMGLYGAWGTINSYFFSYFYYNGIQVDKNTNSYIILIIVVPVAACVLGSVKLCNRFGYESVIKVCALVYLGFPLINLILDNFVLFLLLDGLIPLCALLVGSIAQLHCIWSHFPQDKTKVTSALYIAGSIGQIFFTFMFAILINPNNQPPISNDPFPLYAEELVHKALLVLNLLMFVCGVVNLIGAFMITRNQVEEEENQIVVSELASRQQFLLLFVMLVILLLFPIYVRMNLKIVYMPYFNNDYLINLLLVAAQITSFVGTLFWGVMGDIYSSRKMVPVIVVVVSIISIYLAFVREKVPVFIGFSGLGFIDKGMLVLYGPTLIEIFGLNRATELIPSKGVALFISLILAPVLSILLTHWMSIDSLMKVLALMNVLSIGLAVVFHLKVSPQMEEIEEIEQI